jgi:hypothetical protein
MGKKINELRYNNGGESISKNLDSFGKEVVIKREEEMPYNQQ